VDVIRLTCEWLSQSYGMLSKEMNREWVTELDYIGGYMAKLVGRTEKLYMTGLALKITSLKQSTIVWHCK
jgi:hypothetical protein